MSGTDGTMPPPGPRGPVLISVCVSCRGPEGSPPEARPGEDLLATLRRDVAASGADIRVRAVQCLSVCKRPCTVALTGPDRYTYVFGDLDPATGSAAILEGARTFASIEHGYMLWRERPEALRRGIVARIPPADWDPDDGSHPR
ncbi:DUF1636 domain-containing protein [uncultured Enterovirga sp.]|uniref:DUF1636 domain-containing protein n=1 Tax=uncultured Enterovirga sp. TaxID=2026352 RepID=UPI0035CBF307